ncbi:MAG: sigma-70 family RNA polymerase sigma factor [Anaerolineales bacterium]|nr:sigma-70 family RNA polymerase sigma factor [Anaerolineales bacterium]
MFDQNQTNIITRAQRGDVDSIGQLYDQHQNAVFRYLWARLGERPQAEDLTGEVFLHMLDALPNYRATAPFRAWLYRIARNLLIDHYRKHNHAQRVPLETAEAQPAPETDVLNLAERRITLNRLQAALNQLDETQREVVTLRFLAGLSLQETAAALEKTEAAIKALQHRGLAALRQALTSEEVVL